MCKQYSSPLKTLANYVEWSFCCLVNLVPIPSSVYIFDSPWHVLIAAQNLLTLFFDLLWDPCCFLVMLLIYWDALLILAVLKLFQWQSRLCVGGKWRNTFCRFVNCRCSVFTEPMHSNIIFLMWLYGTIENLMSIFRLV